MAFKVENFYSTVSNIQNSKAQISHYEYWNENDNDVTATGYFPAILGMKHGDTVTVFSSDKEERAEYFVNENGALEPTGLTVVKNDVDDLGDAVQGIQEKLPDVPANGKYFLQAEKSDTGIVYSWEEITE